MEKRRKCLITQIIENDLAIICVFTTDSKRAQFVLLIEIIFCHIIWMWVIHFEPFTGKV